MSLNRDVLTLHASLLRGSVPKVQANNSVSWVAASSLALEQQGQFSGEVGERVDLNTTPKERFYGANPARIVLPLFLCRTRSSSSH